MGFTATICRCFFFVSLAESFILHTKPRFAPALSVGTLNDPIDEASGLAASRQHPGVLYTHNDKGDSSRFFAVNATNGALMATFTVDHAANYDWEDMAVSVCPGSNTTFCIYIGDFGDHGGDGSKNKIYVVAEPSSIKSAHVQHKTVLHYQWSALNVETLLVDPKGNAYVVSNVNGGRGEIGKIPASAFLSNGTFTITETSTLNIPVTKGSDPNGGDICEDGDHVLIRTDDHIYYWEVENFDYLHKLSTENPDVIHSHREHKPQGIAWDKDGVSFYTCSEGHGTPLYYYKRLM